jgi:hypothetical protein
MYFTYVKPFYKWQAMRNIEKDKIKENKSFEEEIKEISTINHSLDKIVLLGTDIKN